MQIQSSELLRDSQMMSDFFLRCAALMKEGNVALAPLKRSLVLFDLQARKEMTEDECQRLMGGVKQQDLVAVFDVLVKSVGLAGRVKLGLSSEKFAQIFDPKWADYSHGECLARLVHAVLELQDARIQHSFSDESMEMLHPILDKSLECFRALELSRWEASVDALHGLDSVLDDRDTLLFISSLLAL